MHDREVGEEPAFHHVLMAVELAHFFSLGDHSSNTRLRVEGRDARAPCSNPFGQRALGVELHGEVSVEKLLREELVLAHVGRDHLLDLTRLEHHAEADSVDACVVGDHREVLHAGFRNRFDQGFGNSAEPKAAGHQRHAVTEQPVEGCRRVRKYLLGHGSSLPPAFSGDNPRLQLNPSIFRASEGDATSRPALRAHWASASMSGPFPLVLSPLGR